MLIQVGPLTVTFENEILCIQTGQACFKTQADGMIVMQEGTMFAFKDFASRTIKPYCSGTFEGFYVEYSNHPSLALALRTFYLVDTTTYALKLSLLVLEENDAIKEIRWPFAFQVEQGYHVLPLRQGLLYPIEKKIPLDIPFSGTVWQRSCLPGDAGNDPVRWQCGPDDGANALGYTLLSGRWSVGICTFA